MHVSYEAEYLMIREAQRDCDRRKDGHTLRCDALSERRKRYFLRSDGIKDRMTGSHVHPVHKEVVVVDAVAPGRIIRGSLKSFGRSIVK